MENWRGVQGMCPLMILFYDNWIDPLLKKFLYWCMKWSKWTLSLSLHPICNHTTIVVGYQRDPKGLRFYYSKEPKTTIFRFSIEEFFRQKEYVFLPNFVNASSLSSNGNFSRAHRTPSVLKFYYVMAVGQKWPRAEICPWCCTRYSGGLRKQHFPLLVRVQLEQCQ